MRLKKSLIPTLSAMLLAAPAGAQDVSAEQLVERVSCLACHSLGGKGALRAPAWDGVGQRLSPPILREQLIRPQSRRMPSYAFLRPHELEALVKYLAGLQTLQ